MKKKIIIILLLILTITVGFLIKKHNNNMMFLKREYIIALIKSNELEVKSNGIVVLPKKYQHLSDSGECQIIEFNGKTAVYFYSYRGLLDSSKGYVYTTEEIDYKDYIDLKKYNPSLDIANIEQLSNVWFFCSTK